MNELSATWLRREIVTYRHYAKSQTIVEVPMRVTHEIRFIEACLLSCLGASDN